MDVFRQNTLLFRTMLILAALNLFSVGFFLWRDARHHNKRELKQGRNFHEVAGILKKELNLTSEQERKIKQLRMDFFVQEQILSGQIRSARDSMNAEMFTKDTDSLMIRQLARHIAANEYKMEMLRFDQAQKFKSVCTSAQLEKMEHLVIEIRDYFKPEKNDRKHRKKR